jgi:hypothetical protein
MSPKFENLTDFDWLMKLLDHCRSVVSLKEVMGQRQPSQTNGIIVSVVRSARHCYPITRARFERFEIHMPYLILLSILCFINLSVIVYTSKL